MEEGDELGLILIQIKMDCENKQVILTQRTNIELIIIVYGVPIGALTPATVNLMGDAEESPTFYDQKEFFVKRLFAYVCITESIPQNTFGNS